MNLSQVQIVALQLSRSDDPAGILVRRGVDGLVNDYLRDQLAQFPKDQGVAETLLSLMITRQGTRRVIAESDLSKKRQRGGFQRKRQKPLFEKLVVGTRLIRRDYNRGTTTYEIISEFLVPWIRVLKLRRETREARNTWILRAVLLLVGIAAVLGAVFAWRCKSLTEKSLTETIVMNYVRDLGQAKADQKSLPKPLDDTLRLLSAGKDEKVGSLSTQVSDLLRAAAAESARSSELSWRLAAQNDVLQKTMSDLDAACRTRTLKLISDLTLPETTMATISFRK